MAELRSPEAELKSIKPPGEREESEDAVAGRLLRVQFKMLKPLVWKALAQSKYHVDLAKMGLFTFFKTRFSDGDENLCRSFLSTYNRHGSGVVGQRVVHSDPRTVEIALRLPHNGKPVKEVPKLTAADLHSLFNGPTVKVYHNGYCVKALCDPYFREFVTFLVDRISCKVHCTYVSAEMLHAAKYVWETKSTLDWAGYMSQRIQVQCEKVRGTSYKAFEYTQYLTQIIQYQLGTLMLPQEEEAQPYLTEGLVQDTFAGQTDPVTSTAGQQSQSDLGSPSQSPIYASPVGGEMLLLDGIPRELNKDMAEVQSEAVKGSDCLHDGEEKNNIKRVLQSKRLKDLKRAKRDKVPQEGLEYILNLVTKVTTWIKNQHVEHEYTGLQLAAYRDQYNSTHARVMQLEGDLNTIRSRYEFERQKRLQFEAQCTQLREEKSKLEEQAQDGNGKQELQGKQNSVHEWQKHDQPKFTQSEAEIAIKEKLCLEEQVQSLRSQQQALSQQLELLEREKSHLIEQIKIVTKAKEIINGRDSNLKLGNFDKDLLPP